MRSFVSELSSIPTLRDAVDFAIRYHHFDAPFVIAEWNIIAPFDKRFVPYFSSKTVLTKHLYIAEEWHQGHPPIMVHHVRLKRLLILAHT